ncbi:MAG: hypothetical protein U0U69_03335 [Acidimicrobiia bacterium]
MAAIASVTTAALSARWRCASAKRTASLFGKYWYSDPIDTPAASATPLVVVAAYPRSSKMRAASSRMRA